MKKIFKPRSRLLLHLWDKLMRNENIAIVELVKNSYDAGAFCCDIELNNVDNLEIGEICIRDDGVWMTPEIIDKVWLEPWTDFKELLIKENWQTSFWFEFDVPKRTPIWEKWVWRFGVHKLWNYIEMITKSRLSKKEVVVIIDWQIFEREKYLKDAFIDIIEREPISFLKWETWTILKIKNLKKSWDMNNYKDLYRTISLLNSPFSYQEWVMDDRFEVNLKLNLENKEIQEDWQSWLFDTKCIKGKALWKLNAEIEWKVIKRFDYEFIPYTSMDKLDKRMVSIEHLKKFNLNKLKDRDWDFDLWKYNIWNITIEIFWYDLSLKILKLWLVDTKVLRDYLTTNWWVRVYRDWLRVYDYWEPWNDWLNLDKLRINDPTKLIWNKNIIWAVKLDRRKSMDLTEKTNREWFVENDAYNLFLRAVRLIIKLFSEERTLDKTKIRELYEGSDINEPVLSEIDKIKDLINKKFENINDENKAIIQNNILVSLDKMKKNFIETRDILLKSASAWLSLGVVLHEIEKRIKTLEWFLNNEVNSESISNLRISIKNIMDLIEWYAKLLNTNNKKTVILSNIINWAIFNCEFRFKAHKIEVTRDYLNFWKIEINHVENVLIWMLLNIFDNSIYWLNFYEIDKKKLFITLKEYDEKTIWLIVADNGKWFSIPWDMAIKPFISKKIGGMWLWLHIVDEMMKINDGTLIIRNYEELYDIIPNEFKFGAIIELIFTKNW